MSTTKKQAAVNAMTDKRALNDALNAIRDGIKASQTAARALQHDAADCPEISGATDLTAKMLAHMWDELTFLYDQMQNVDRLSLEAYHAAERAELALQEQQAVGQIADAGTDDQGDGKTEAAPQS
jgi:hypothetical protein